MRGDDLSADAANDVPGIRIPPPLYFLAAVGAGLALGRGTPSKTLKATCAVVSGGVCLAGSAAMVIAAGYELRRVNTTFNPYKPSAALATGGIYGYTRNPMYLSLTLASIGIAMWQRSIPALTFVPIALARLETDVVDKEERYLERRFGATYRAYRNLVPRWF
jgi:protein-S-isoprenylcysteine O-methyltransferase Ste14